MNPTSIVFVIYFVIVNILLAKALNCMGFWNNSCKRNGDCCSGYFCEGDIKWEFGVCKSKNHAEKNEIGICSYYKGSGITASGEPFLENELTAAHRTLPFNTMVKVKYDGQSVIVRINDRGPFIPKRILDLSMGAAKKINMIKKGIVRCELQILSNVNSNFNRINRKNPSNSCKGDWDNTCLEEENCCSMNCYKKPEWEKGICMPKIMN